MKFTAYCFYNLCKNESMRSIVCNPQLVAECNHFEEMYVIHRRWYVINPKEDTPAVMPYTLRVITCAYRRLHTNPSDWIKIKHFFRSALFFGSPSWTRTNDPAVNSRMLYRLSYRGIFVSAPFYFPGQLPAKYFRR